MVVLKFEKKEKKRPLDLLLEIDRTWEQPCGKDIALLTSNW